MSLPHSRFLAPIGALLIVFLVALPAAAHPLGNFTISHHLGIHVLPDVSELQLILDFAEIPTFQIKREITEADTLSELESTTLAEERCNTLRTNVSLTTSSVPLELHSEASDIEFLPGQGDLETMRLTCDYRFDTPTTLPTDLAVSDTSYQERIGWREIVITSEGIDIDSTALTASPTQRLRVYPAEGIASARNDRAATVTLVGLGDGTGRDVVPEAVASPPSAPRTIVERIGRALSPERLSETPLIVAIIAALGLGFAHAVAPGHGKTLVAAYLVGNRGTWRHAVALGLTVAVSHTIGVAVLGGVTFAASAAFTPERLYPYLAGASGLIVLGMGIYLVVRTWRNRQMFSPDQDREHSLEHQHSHEHGPGHEPGHEPEVEAPDLTHSHGGRAHSHAVSSDITWKGLAALGISGGLVPSASAVVLLLGAINLGRTGLGLVLVLLFGLGMATALVAAGLLVVGAERIGMRALGDRRWVTSARRTLPLMMALAVLAVGVFLTLNAVNALNAG